MSVCNDKVCEAATSACKKCSSLIPSLCGKNGLSFPASRCKALHFEGVQNVTINQGVGIDLTEGVKAYDRNDNEIEYTVSPEEIAKCDVGEHTVTYTAVGTDDVMRPSVCGTDTLHVSCDEISTLTETRIVTIEQADPPHITIPDVCYTCEAEVCEACVSGTTIEPNTDFDPMSGVSAVDDNGNALEVEYEGEYDVVASGAIVSFENDYASIAKSLKVSLEPIQDLNGYDKPWSGGSGKNLLNPNSYIIGTGSHYNAEAGVVLSQGGSTSRATTEGENPITVDVKVDWAGITYISDVIKSGQQYRLSCNVTIPTSSGARATVYRIGADDYEVKYRYNNYTNAGNISVLVEPSEDARIAVYIGASSVQAVTVNNLQLELGSTATSYEPYSNICPIYGRTEVETYVSGVNVWDEEWEVGGIVIASGEPYSTSDRIRSKNFCGCVPNTSYYAKSPTNKLVVFWYDANKTYINSTGWKGNTAITSPSNAHYFKVVLIDVTTYNSDISINYPSTDTDYHAYNGTSYETDLGQTVYGGTLDVVSGELVVDRAMVDLGDYTFLKYSSLNVYYAHFSDAKFELLGKLSDRFNNVSVSLTSVANGEMRGRTDNDLIYFGSDLTTASEFNAWCQENHPQLVYELATPQTYQLTPTEIKLLLGNNNVFSDGEVTIVYADEIPQGGSYEYAVEGTYEITYTAEDECGNKTEVTKTIIVAE